MKTIIMLEDDPAIRDAMGRVFNELEFTVIVFPDAGPILAGKYSIPDIFIIDNQLPGASGLDICRHLKSQHSTSQIPIIIISANPRISRLATEAGASDFLEKPYSLRQMRDMVAEYV